MGPSYRDHVLRSFVDVASFYVTTRYAETFARFEITRDLIFNGEFHLLVGGPKWLDSADPQRACIRKYFGVRGLGDFLLITSHPREMLEYHSVLHSHTAPALWLGEDYYAEFPKFASLRNPLGVVNSAAFSLNAMASEYIQKFMPCESEDFIRRRHGLYKLTDLEFFSGLVRFLKAYLDEFIPVKDRYFVMKWEDLITSPVDTINRVAEALGVPCSREIAESVWRPMDHVNLLQYHKHNYRRGKGIVGDWKNSLVNEHMEVFRSYGFDPCLDKLGYGPVPELNPRDYSPYQKLVARRLRGGRIYRNTGDPDLFGFAFNKSNIDASKFNFKSFPKRSQTHVERSTLSRDDVVQAVSDTAEDSCEKINRMFVEIAGLDMKTPRTAMKAARDVEHRCRHLLGELPEGRGREHCGRIFGTLYKTLEQGVPPSGPAPRDGR